MNPAWSIFGALAAAILGGLIVHFGARSRDRENDRRRQRVDYLVNAYRTLARSAHRDIRGERGEAFEDALSDVVLLGTSDQIAAARGVVSDLRDKREASIDELLASLRSALRRELGSEADQLRHVPLLRMSWSDKATLFPVRTQDGTIVQFQAVMASTLESLGDAVTRLPEVASLSAGAEFDRLRELTERAPGTAVVEAYGMVGERLFELLADEAADHHPISRDALDLARVAAPRGLISAQSLDTIQGLSILMKLSRGGGSGAGLSPEKANEYIDLVAATLYSLRRPGG